MKKTIKKIIATSLTLILSAAISISPVFAEQGSPTTFENGNYTSKINYYKKGTTDFTYSNTSMCNSLFVREADITLTQNNCIIDTYVAFPVPNYKDKGKEGTITNVKLTYNNNDYDGVSDIETKSEKKFTEIAFMANIAFGITEGDVLPTQKITFTLPREAINDLDKGLDISAYINVSLNRTEFFKVRVTEITKVGNSEPDVENPSEEKTQSMELSASIGAPKPSYTVDIPSSVNLGLLSSEKNNDFKYTIKVDTSNLGKGHIEISAPNQGELQASDGKKIKFTNTLETKNITETKTVNGTFTVLGEDVKSATAGDYSGATEFTIKYFAEK